MSNKSILQIDLLLINILTLLLVLVTVLSPSNALRTILGLPYMLFFPGYIIVAALFPKKGGVSGIERALLSFGVSIVVVILVGLALNFTPWGLGLYGLVAALTVLIIVGSAVAWYRRSRLPADERFHLPLRISVPSWRGLSKADRVLSVVLLLSIVVALGVLGYVAAAPREGERFTEFYVLGSSGQAQDYPRDLVVGEPASVIIGIVHHEGEETSYTLEVTMDGVKDSEVGPIVLADGETWEEEVSFLPEVAGDGQKVEFLLYRDGENEPCQTLHLFIDVGE